MLTGKELGAAIDAAIRKKGITKAELAREFGVKPPSVQDWVKHGRISKTHLPHLLAYFADVAGPEHWGLPSGQTAQSSTPLSGGVESNRAGEYNAQKAPPSLLTYPVDTSKFRRVYVVGRAQGGFPDRIWTDGDYPVGATDQYAEVASTDPHAFLCPVVGTSMSPRFNPGEFALVEPGTEPELEDDVLVRLVTGETMIKRLLSRRDGIRLGSYNEPAVLHYKPEEISWIYYIAHGVPARKIKTRL